MPLPPPPKKRASTLASNHLPSGDKEDDRDHAATQPAQAVPAPRTTRRKTSRQDADAAPAGNLRPAAETAETPSAALAAATSSARGGKAALFAAAPAPAPAPARKTAAAQSPAKAAKNGPRKLFVLDTNVLMHDPTCLFRFEEHDVYLALIVLEEMDSHKKGANEVARNVRQASRMLDALVATAPKDQLGEGMPLSAIGNREATGRLFFQTQMLDYSLPLNALPQGKADNQILGVVAALEKQHAGREVVLVSKDINMRVKARALGLAAEDYQNDKALEDDELLYSGIARCRVHLGISNHKTLLHMAFGDSKVAAITDLLDACDKAGDACSVPAACSATLTSSFSESKRIGMLL